MRNEPMLHIHRETVLPFLQHLLRSIQASRVTGERTSASEKHSQVIDIVWLLEIKYEMRFITT